MNIYRMIGNKIASPEAIELAERLSSWHDAMVAHERMTRTSCGDDCPHGDAPVLWRLAAETFGPHATELVFLRSRALGPRSVAPAGRGRP